jgi:hypothetical protein
LGRGEKEDEKILTMCPQPDLFPRGGEGRKDFNDTSHFYYLSKGRDELKECPLTLTLSREVERGEGK